ncbi:MAG TPA: GNAT family protein [Candidatus Binataceae bacterium]|nr:GNAT family protein [Candidatus Binataceae bacterium]
MIGKLVKLRGYEKSDADALVRWFSDEEVTEYLGPVAVPMTRAFQERMIEELLARDSPVKAFAIEALSGELIGDCGLREISWVSRKADLFITIGDKSYWGRGYGADAVRLLLRLAFESMNLNSVVLTTLATNTRAIKCYEKCGFEKQGLFRENSFVRGKFVDVVPMGILRADWERSRP